ncbi:proline-rich protein HaeIII subfamily 1-like [Lathamus discolor]|uniref:proline-rich protein HaeIII subfamily 1-like n=1 Tax=Lathamus discolor TaxID=678569 RepID=UPI0032B739F3
MWHTATKEKGWLLQIAGIARTVHCTANSRSVRLPPPLPLARCPHASVSNTRKKPKGEALLDSSLFRQHGEGETSVPGRKPLPLPGPSGDSDRFHFQGSALPPRSTPTGGAPQRKGRLPARPPTPTASPPGPQLTGRKGQRRPAWPPGPSGGPERGQKQASRSPKRCRGRGSGRPGQCQAAWHGEAKAAPVSAGPDLPPVTFPPPDRCRHGGGKRRRVALPPGHSPVGLGSRTRSQRVVPQRQPHRHTKAAAAVAVRGLPQRRRVPRFPPPADSRRPARRFRPLT